MTDHTANAELDRIFGGEDGDSPIRFAIRPRADLRVVDGSPPAVQPHMADAPDMVHLLVAYLEGAIIHERACLADDDPGALRADYQSEHRGALLAFERIRERIDHYLAEEAEERARVGHEDRVEASYRDAYGPEADKLAAWQAEGR